MEDQIQKKRIVELDSARGIAVFCMVAIHVFDMGRIYGGWDFEWTGFLNLVKHYGGAFFVLLSGVCATLGSRSVRRGIIVLVCAMTFTGLSVWLYLSGREDESILIQWGVLHCIGTCMLLWPLCKKMPLWLRGALGAAIAAAGYYIRFQLRVRNPWLFPLGLRNWNFTAFDYFPLMPHLGWFLIGSVLGELIYAERRPLIPSLKPGVFAFAGRHSLAIYMIHLPLLYMYFRFWR